MTSIAAMNWALEQDTRSSGERLVLLTLAMCTGGDEDDPRVCWPSVARLAKLTRIGASTVRSHIDALTERGLLTKYERRRRKDGTLGTWVYLVMFTTADVAALGEELAPMEQCASADGAAVVQRRPGGALEVSISEQSIESPTAPASFDAFWTAYPRGAGKVSAVKAWTKLKPADRNAAMAALPQHMAVWRAQKRGMDKVPHASTWLNQRRWEDDLRGEQRVTSSAGDNPFLTILREGNELDP